MYPSTTQHQCSCSWGLSFQCSRNCSMKILNSGLIWDGNKTENQIWVVITERSRVPSLRLWKNIILTQHRGFVFSIFSSWMPDKMCHGQSICCSMYPTHINSVSHFYKKVDECKVMWIKNFLILLLQTLFSQSSFSASGDFGWREQNAGVQGSKEGKVKAFPPSYNSCTWFIIIFTTPLYVKPISVQPTGIHIWSQLCICNAGQKWPEYIYDRQILIMIHICSITVISVPN